MAALFVDTWGWLALRDKGERQHKLAVAAGDVLLEPIHPVRFREAVKLRLKYKDKPEISFTDFTSMVVMRELALKRVLTEDRHFAQPGLGFELVP